MQSQLIFLAIQRFPVLLANDNQASSFKASMVREMLTLHKLTLIKLVL
jgi:hypothetical protein